MADERIAAPAAEAGAASGSWSERLIEWAARHPQLPLLIALVAAVLARVLLVVRSNALIDGDEALVGIQAEHILRGDRPIYFYGQAYMGSLEAYFAAALFRVFGPSPWALRAVPIALSLLLVYLTWRLARALLPKDARTTPLLAGLAALFAAVPPLYDAVTELRTWGGQIEVYVITLALLLVTVELSRRIREGARPVELAWRWALWGFLAGLGLWINPLVSYALLAAALWLGITLLRVGLPGAWRRLPRLGSAADGDPAWRPGALVPVLVALPALALGALPVWIYAAQHSGENLLVYVTQPTVSPADSGAARYGRLFLGAAITARYATCVAPQVLNGMMPAEPLLPWLPLRLALLVPPLVGIVTALWLLRRRGDAPLRVGMPLLYASVITLVFCLGTSAWPATKRCDNDLAGRYAVPLVLVEPFLLLAAFAAPRLWHAIRRWRGWASGSLSAEAAARGWRVVLLVLLVGGAVQFGTYTLSDARAAFQSPFYRQISMDRSSLLAYLRANNIRYAWCNHWLGNIVTFETGGQTTCADYYDQVIKGGIQRPPGTLQAVSAAERPSFIIARVDPHPVLARQLDARGIKYTIAVLPAAHATVITPAVPVDPATVVDGLFQDYGDN